MGSVSQRVLLVGGGQSRCARLGRLLQEAGFQLDSTVCLGQATRMLNRRQGKRYSAMIVHQGVAGPGLVDFCRDSRLRAPGLVIIALLIRPDGQVDLELVGSDVDAIITDQHLLEAVAGRVVMKLARRPRLESPCDRTYIGEVLVDLANGRILRDGDYTAITVREAGVLRELLRNAGETVSRRDLRRSVWNDSVADPLGRTIDVFISRLRGLIEPDRKRPIYLKTVHGYGYKLDLPQSDAREAPGPEALDEITYESQSKPPKSADAQGGAVIARPLVDDELWGVIEPLLPPPKPRRAKRPGRKPLDRRKILTGILFVLKTGIPWGQLPRAMGCGSGMTCWRYLKAWREAGVWDKVHEALSDRLRIDEQIDR